nr:diguanylate cyclase [Xylophilus sp.]
MGGDEFTIVLPGIRTPAESVRRAEALLAALSGPWSVAGRPVRLRASIGIALSPDHGDEAEALMRCADIAMYEAKRRGRGRCALYAAPGDAETPAEAGAAG